VAGDLAKIEGALKRTQNNALGQLGFGVVILASFIIWPSGSLFTAIFIGLNALFSFFFGRRLWRLRRAGPVARALLTAPGDIASIHQWPPKLPDNPKAFPIGLDVRTKDGHVAMLLLDQKDKPDAHTLVAALRERSPDAVVVFTPAPPKLIVP
jgi:hypothetical protein